MFIYIYIICRIWKPFCTCNNIEAFYCMHNTHIYTYICVCIYIYTYIDMHMYVYVHTYYQNLPYLTFWGMAVNRLVHNHAPSTSILSTYGCSQSSNLQTRILFCSTQRMFPLLHRGVFHYFGCKPTLVVKQCLLACLYK